MTPKKKEIEKKPEIEEIKGKVSQDEQGKSARKLGLSGKEEIKKETKREIVVPGEVIVSGDDFLPGDGTKREGNNIIAVRFGLAEKSGRLVKIIALSGTYKPRGGNTVIARIEDITFNGWITDVKAHTSAFLPLSECPGYIDKNGLAEKFGIGDVIVCKITSVKSKGIDLTVKGRGLGKLEEGMLIHINSNKVPRVIGKEGSMIKIIKDATNCNIMVGQNGVVWIRGNKVEDELKAKEAIFFIAEKSFVSGLTDKVKDFLEKGGKK